MTADTYVAPIAELMRRYAFAYTASHDFDVIPQLMVPDYTLYMGAHEVRGRDGAYRAATKRQYGQFPGLGFTVHQLIHNGERVALVFTEHGGSAYRDGRCAAWTGISLYRWDGQRLISCRVEQDYFSRRRQLGTGERNPIASPAHDPWTSPAQPSRSDAEATVRAWLQAGRLLDAPAGSLDDESVGADVCRVRMAIDEVVVADLFSAGDDVAFHVLLRGPYQGGLPASADGLGTPVSLYATGIARVRGDQVTGVQAVTNRLDVAKSLAAAS